MKPFYVDDNYLLEADKIDIDNDFTHKVFLASDIEKLIKGRIQEYKKGKTIASRFYPGDELNSCEINELESLLSALEGGEK